MPEKFWLCSKILIVKSQSNINNVKGKYKLMYCNIPVFSFFHQLLGYEP